MAITVQLLVDGYGGERFGDHYLGHLPSAITVECYGATSGAWGSQCGATAWTAYDIAGNQVGTGTMSATDQSFPVSSTTSWIGGSTIVAGWYHIVTNNANSSAAYVVVCPLAPGGGASNLPMLSTLPSLYTANGTIGIDMGAWSGANTWNRDCFQLDNPDNTNLLANIQADTAYLSGGDGVRPRDVWISATVQGLPNTSVYTTAASWGAHWAALTTKLAGAGITGCIWEIPVNEPENDGGYGAMSTAQIISYSNAVKTAIHAVDSTARFAVFCSGGYDNSSFTRWATVLAGLSFTPDYLSTHMESQIENLADFVSLRQYFDGLKSVSATIPWLFTETGFDESAYGVFQPRRGPRQRAMFRLVAEMYGWPMTHQCDWPLFAHPGTAIYSYQIEVQANNYVGGNLRPGLYANRVMAEALWGTAYPPAKLTFGPTGGPGDSLFIGAHYTGSGGDVVVLGTNGVSGASVTLNCSSTTGVHAWDGAGKTRSVTVSGGHITVAVDDLLTYIFLPASTTVSVVDTDQGIVAMSSQINVIPSGVTKNGAGTTATILNNNSFSESFTDVPGSSAPYEDATVPDTLTTTGLSGTVNGVVLRSAQSGWFGGNLSSPTALTVSINGSTVYSYTNATATTYSRPTGDANSTFGPGIATSTEYWDGTWSWCKAISPVAITGNVVLDITATSNGGTIQASSSGNAQINISEWQVYFTPVLRKSYPVALLGP